MPAVPLRDLDGLVDHDGGSEGRLEEEFADRNSQDVAVHDGHSRQPPVFRSGLDGAVDLLLAGENLGDNPVRVFPDFGSDLLMSPIQADQVLRIRRVELQLEKDLAAIKCGDKPARMPKIITSAVSLSARIMFSSTSPSWTSRR